MSGVKQAGKIAHHRLKDHLYQSDYVPRQQTQSLWRHKTLPIRFTLVVDDFRIKYTTKQHVKHLINKLQKNTSSQITGPEKLPVIGNRLESPIFTCQI